MKKALLALLIVALAGAGGAWIISIPRPAFSGQEAARLNASGDAGRGEAVFYAGGCASCHATPGQEDPLKLGGGLALESAYGTFHAPNISPHPADGIGTWTNADLANAMMAGVSPAGHHYYPAFPYTSYAAARPEDAADLMAFIRTLPPVEGKAPDHDLPFPFNIRRSLGLWKALFFERTPLADDPAQSASWNRGRYLVETLGHCAECHSPRNMLGAIEKGRRLAGGPNPEGEGWIPNITPHADGIGNWSAGEIVELLTTGFTPEFDSAGGSMAAVVQNTGKLTSADREAMAEYLKSLRPIPGARPKAGE